VLHHDLPASGSCLCMIRFTWCSHPSALVCYMIINLIEETNELFWHFYGLRRRTMWHSAAAASPHHTLSTTSSP
jgi:hypothetical protein